MTLQDLRDVLSAALDSAYSARAKVSKGHAYHEAHLSTENNIQLLRLLDEGVRRTMEKRSTEVAAMAELAPHE